VIISISSLSDRLPSPAPSPPAAAARAWASPGPGAVPGGAPRGGGGGWSPWRAGFSVITSILTRVRFEYKYIDHVFHDHLQAAEISSQIGLYRAERLRRARGQTPGCAGPGRLASVPMARWMGLLKGWSGPAGGRGVRRARQEMHMRQASLQGSRQGGIGVVTGGPVHRAADAGRPAAAGAGRSAMVQAAPDSSWSAGEWRLPCQRTGKSVPTAVRLPSRYSAPGSAAVRDRCGGERLSLLGSVRVLGCAQDLGQCLLGRAQDLGES